MHPLPSPACSFSHAGRGDVIGVSPPGTVSPGIKRKRRNYNEASTPRLTLYTSSRSASSQQSLQPNNGETRLPDVPTVARNKPSHRESSDSSGSAVSAYVPNSQPLPTITTRPSFFSPSYNLSRIVSCDYDPATGSDIYVLETRQPPVTSDQQYIKYKHVPATEILQHVSRGELEIFETREAARKARDERQAAEGLKRKILDRRARGLPSETPSSRSASESNELRKPRGRPRKNDESHIGWPFKLRPGASGYPMVVVPVKAGSMSLQMPEQSTVSIGETKCDIEANKLIEDQEEPEWEVLKILDDGIARDGPGVRVYLVQWIGYGEATWEPLKNLNGAEEALEAYWMSKKAKHEKYKETADLLREVEAYKSRQRSEMTISGGEAMHHGMDAVSMLDGSGHSEVSF